MNTISVEKRGFGRFVELWTCNNLVLAAVELLVANSGPVVTANMQIISTAWAQYIQHVQKSCLGSRHPFMVNSVSPDSTENGPDVLSVFKTSHVKMWQPNDILSDVSLEGALWIFQVIGTYKEHPWKLIVRGFACPPKGAENGVSG